MGNRLGVKFVILVVGILSLTLVTNAWWFLDRQQRLLHDQLIERGSILGHFVSIISAEAILGFDFITLENYVKDVTKRQDIVFSVVLDENGAPLTNFIDQSNPKVKSLANGKDFDSILDLLTAARHANGIYIEQFPITERENIIGYVIVGISRDRLERELTENFFRQVLVYFSIILFLSVAIYLVFRFNVLFPVRELIRGSRRVADGHYDEAVKVVSKDELGVLTQSFNTMMEEVRKDRELLNFQANFDSLTGLPNRMQAVERLRSEISRAEREGYRFAVIFIDLNNFKFINDTMGHMAGDNLLISLSHRFKSVLRESDIIARLGGDEFLVMLPTADKPTEVKEAALRLITSLTDPILIEKREVFLRCSMGIAIYPSDGTSAEELMANADNAMYQAKLSRTDDFRFFAPEMNRVIKERMLLEQDLHLALEKNQFQLYYQPIVDAHSRQAVGAEILLRWVHPEKGVISPQTFIPLAEATGRIIPIGKWVLITAVQECCNLLSQGLEPGFFSINVSRVQLSQDFEATVKETLRDSCLETGRLRLEVTESALMEHYGELPEMLRRLDALGVKLVLDDFGTGFSSLNYLKHFPFHTLKIDKSFVDGVPLDEGDVSLVRGIIAMGRSLGLSVVAEGVETEEQYRFLIDSDVDRIQGYLFARPLSREEYTDYLRQQHPLGGAMPADKSVTNNLL